MKELWVEGKNDAIVFSNIFREYHVDKHLFEVIDKGNIDEIYKSISNDLQKLDFSIIGIILDADSDMIGRWISIKTKLEKEGYNLPDTPSPLGTIMQGNEELPRLGIWIMPNNDENGMLEDFVKFLIPADDLLMPYVDNSLAIIEERELNKYKPIHQAKARIHTWLAWQESPGTPMGAAITKTYLDTNQELCNQFVDWINRLFNNDKLNHE
jgi:hypothetical protein